MENINLTMFKHCWVDTHGPVIHLPPDLTPLDTFLYRYVKNVVYGTNSRSIEELQNNLFNVIHNIDHFLRVHKFILNKIEEFLTSIKIIFTQSQIIIFYYFCYSLINKFVSLNIGYKHEKTYLYTYLYLSMIFQSNSTIVLSLY